MLSYINNSEKKETFRIYWKKINKNKIFLNKVVKNQEYDKIYIKILNYS